MEDVNAVYSANKCFFRGVKARSEGGKGHGRFCFASGTWAGPEVWNALSDAVRIWTLVHVFWITLLAGSMVKKMGVFDHHTVPLPRRHGQTSCRTQLSRRRCWSRARRSVTAMTHFALTHFALTHFAIHTARAP